MAEEEQQQEAQEEQEQDGKKDEEVAATAEKPDAVKNALKAEREAAREAKKRAEEAEAKVKEYEDRDKSESEKAAERLKELETQASAAELKALRFEVAAEKGIPLDQAHRLQGADKEELAKDAEEFAKSFKAAPGGMDGGARGSSTADDDMNSRLREAAGLGRAA